MSLIEPPIQVAGRDPLVDRVLQALRASGRRVRRLDLERLGRVDPARCAALVLADPPGPDRLIRRLAFPLPGRRHRPLRVVLMRSGDAPAAVPESVLWPQGPLLVEQFGIADRAARAILARWPLHLGFDPAFGQRPHLLIAGFGLAARAFLVHALRLIQYGERRPLVTIICADPSACSRWLEERHPESGEVAEIRWLARDASGLGDSSPPSLVLVCLDPPSDGLDMAARIRDAAGGCAPILLEVGDAEPVGEIEDWDGRIIPVSFLAEACRAEVILDGAGDALARTIHEHYTDTIAAQGRDPAAEAAGQPWEGLSESYREANRHQADQVSAKLAVTDCRAVPEERVHSFAFAPLEVEQLAVIEHLRWSADRFLDGWRYAAVRDNALKHHPQLIPYDALSVPMKDLDRFAVRGLPALLARSGLGIVRMLIVGVAQPGPNCSGGRALVPWVDRVVKRLVARFPDRSLVLASTLADPRTRLVARRAMDLGGAGLFLLCPRPLGDLVAAQEGNDRIDLLRLIARAERRIPLAGEAELEEWFACRSEIRLILGAEPPAALGAKCVLLDPSRGRLEWGFEY